MSSLEFELLVVLAHEKYARVNIDFRLFPSSDGILQGINSASKRPIRNPRLMNVMI
jgi:hypothetical protein